MREQECNEQKNQEEQVAPLNTSRKIYIEDYRLLRELSYTSEKKITQILDDMLIHYKQQEFTLKQYNQAVRHTSKSVTNKSIKVPIDFNSYLLDRADSLRTNAKQLLSAMIQDYYNNFYNNK